MNKLKREGYKPPPENSRRPDKPTPPPPKIALTVDEIISKYPESVRILLSELVQKLDALQKKPGVTQEFVTKHTQKIAEYPSQHRIETMLKEAGVEVKE